MITLPQKWTTSTVQGLQSSEVLIGLVPETEGYRLYVTNFNGLWTDTTESVYEYATKLGYSVSLDYERKELVATIHKAIYSSKELKSGLICSYHNGQLDIHIDHTDFKWKFYVHQQDSTQLAAFLAGLNYQQFANQQYLTYKLRQLQHSVQVKDLYIKFLSENFKLSHGSQLINKFKKNNKLDASDMAEFNSVEWDKYVNEQYLSQAKRVARSSEKRLHDIVHTSLTDHSAWNFSNIWLTDNFQPSNISSAPYKQEDPFVEIKLKQEPEMEPELKNEPEPEQEPDETKRGTKRKFGVLKSSPVKKIKKEEQPNQPIRPKKFGSLSQKRRNLK
ncbi:uncharacterized protein RJT21DRAFT_116088 [Scheffersomyces amazonensis]|uniref:uncharacterized protein n=1 Tax=Scheffersomyces amazonensis TaxID=1078765 RepID=UPI00315D9BDF